MLKHPPPGRMRPRKRSDVCSNGTRLAQAFGRGVEYSNGYSITGYDTTSANEPLSYHHMVPGALCGMMD